MTVILCVTGATSMALANEAEDSTAKRYNGPVSRLSLEEALALFLRQNLDVLISSLGVTVAKGQQITARLYPNPILSIGTVGSFATRQIGEPSNIVRSGQVYPQIQQFFEMAGKRGYRIESARYNTQSAEASFEDAIRRLGLTVKDTYYRVQLAQRRLLLAEENRTRFARILAVNTIRFKKGFIAESELIRSRLQIADFQAQTIEANQEAETALADLRMLLALTPTTELVLTTDLEYRPIDPQVERLRLTALDARPDLRAKQFVHSQRMIELKLAKAYRFPDITIGGGYAIQGPRGPDLPQQWALSIGIPLPVFNRNQGGIRQAEIGVESAWAELRNTILKVEMEVDLAYRMLLQSRQIVEAYRAGVVEDARELLTIGEKSYERGGMTILDLLDVARTSKAIQQNYFEAVFNYQQNIFQLEHAIGQEIE